MEDKELKRIVEITFVITLVYIVILALFGNNIFSFNGVKATLSTTAILSAWWWFYFNYGWKIKYLNRILYKENINGTWFGNYESTDIRTGEAYNGEISLVVKQNFLKIKITSITSRFKSYSYSEELNCKDEKNQLIYVYSQDELSSTDHHIRKGVSDLELTIGDDKSTLYGKFWTNSGTIGLLDLTKVSKKQISFFEEAKKLFEESGIR